MVIDTRNNTTVTYQDNSAASRQISSAKDSTESASKNSTSVNFETKSLDEDLVETENKATKKTIEMQQESEEIAEKIQKIVDQINKHAVNTSAKFNYNMKTNKVTVQIYDVDTEEVIKEFPPEKTLDMISKAWEMVGLLVDEKL